jgi:DNA end-binding protein Ku
MPAAPRAAWKGYLKIGSVSCGVKIVGVVTEAEKIRFNVLNRETGNRVRSVYVDEATKKEVPADQQQKGWEADKDEFIAIDPEEIKALKASSEHTLDIEGFVPIKDIDSRYLEKPYYVIPADKVSLESFAVLREAMEETGMAARSCVVMYQRDHDVVIQPYGKGMLLSWLRPHSYIVSEKEIFDDIPAGKLDKDLIDVASMLIDKKLTEFDPSHFEDKYEEALAELIDAKRKGKKLPKRKVEKPKENVVNLAEVLRKSLEREGISARSKGKKSKAA